ncbi:MFS transporter [Amycolatopsis sp. EV170708-02-1]|uniref:MFS transporter n=1 Tax=Amycolatopsis sp. EV170708-02-1 TaxID=2919322 RepID=UPI001F0BC439|nr:MFS transporter [Amycolatopsis sp. EV170708-02-1]UMP07334.1 MFS transporter [Amycolatopsis sp. EV170708-02-1]
MVFISSDLNSGSQGGIEEGVAMASTSGTDPRFRSQVDGPLSARPFRWFFVGRVVSVLGSSMTPVALAFAVLETTSSPEYLGFVLAAAMVPEIVFVLVGGSVADRWRRDVVLRITNVGAGLSQACVAFCVLTKQDPLFLIVLALVNGTLQAFISPAMQGIVPQLVGSANIQKANSMLSASRNTARVLGPSVAGVLVAVAGGGWAIALDAASFLVAAACLTCVVLPTKAKSASANLLRDLCEGWSYFSSTPWISSITLAFMFLNAIQMGVWQVLGPAMALTTIGATGWGLVVSVKAAGLVIAGLAMIKIAVRRLLLTGLIAMSATAIPLVMLGAGSNLVLLATATFVSGLGSAFFGIVWDTVRQRNIPNTLISRVTSYDDFGSYVAIPVGQLAVVPIASAAGMPRVVILGGIIYFVVALLPLALHSVRNLAASDAT